jgi:hypothetical protein
MAIASVSVIGPAYAGAGSPVEDCAQAVSLDDEWIDVSLADATPPVIEAFDLPDPYWGPGDISFNLTVSDESPVCIIIGVPGYFGILHIGTILEPNPGRVAFQMPGTLAIGEGTPSLGVHVIDKAGNITIASREIHPVNPVQNSIATKLDLIRQDLLANDNTPEERAEDNALMDLWSALFRLDLYPADSLRQRVQRATEELQEYTGLNSELQEISRILYRLKEDPEGPGYEESIFPVIDLTTASALQTSLEAVRASIGGDTASAVTHLRIALRPEMSFTPKVFSHLSGEVEVWEKALGEDEPCTPGMTRAECKQQQDVDWCLRWADPYCNWSYLRCTCETLFPGIVWAPGALGGGGIGGMIGRQSKRIPGAFVGAVVGGLAAKGLCYVTMMVFCPFEPSTSSYPVTYYVPAYHHPEYKACVTVCAFGDRSVELSEAC